MCWFRPAFAIAPDCAATRAGDSAWADPGQTVRVCRIGSPTCLCNAARNAATHALSELAVVRAGRNLARGALRGCRSSKIRVLLQRRGVVVPDRTLHRFCVGRCGFGKTTATVRVADGEPGAECQLDFGYLGLLASQWYGRDDGAGGRLQAPRQVVRAAGHGHLRGQRWQDQRLAGLFRHEPVHEPDGIRLDPLEEEAP
jgi:hypothetical protein